MSQMRIPSEVLIEHGIAAMYQALTSVSLLLERDNEQVLTEVRTSKIDNITRNIDKMAEMTAKVHLYKSLDRTRYKGWLKVWGEESICEQSNLNFHNTAETVALLDMIDGTDLVNRKLGNWCSAMVFFYPPKKQILAALIGIPEGKVYCALPDTAPFIVPLRRSYEQNEVKSFQTPQGNQRLEESAVCFYGQKAGNLLSLFGSRKNSPNGTAGGSKFLRRTKRKKLPFRIYNLGGNPMMVRVAEGSMHAVFELLGQKPHDVVPGAFIARCAGAVVKRLDGCDLALEESLMEPNSDSLTYIISTTESLYTEMREKFLGFPPLGSNNAAG